MAATFDRIGRIGDPVGSHGRSAVVGRGSVYMVSAAVCAFEMAITQLRLANQQTRKPDRFPTEMVAVPLFIARAKLEPFAPGVSAGRDIDVTSHLCLYRKAEDKDLHDLILVLPPDASPDQAADCLSTYFGVTCERSSSDCLDLIRATFSSGHNAQSLEILILSLTALRAAGAAGGFPIAVSVS